MRVADALEAVVGAAVGELHDVIDDIAHFLRVDEVRHAEAPRHRFALWVQIDANDLVGADHLRALDHVQANAAQAEHDHVRTRFDLRREQHRADPGGDAAADVADLVERRVVANLGQRDLGHPGVVGEGAGAHEIGRAHV